MHRNVIKKYTKITTKVIHTKKNEWFGQAEHLNRLNLTKPHLAS